MPLADDVDLQRLAKNTEGYVGSDIEAVSREAVMLALRDNLQADKITMKNFRDAMKKIKTEEKVELIQYH
jgi:transitional endoplasmic reticulum ATPase